VWRLLIAAALAVAGVWGAWRSWKRARLCRTALDWRRVPGTITESRVSENTGLDSSGEAETTYSAVVAYAYEVDGVQRTCRSLGLTPESFALPGAARRRLAPYPQGAQVEVLVDPADPDRAALAAKARLDLFVPVLLFAASAAVALGLFGL
jgi:hypothetical protein